MQVLTDSKTKLESNYPFRIKLLDEFSIRNDNKMRKMAASTIFVCTTKVVPIGGGFETYTGLVQAALRNFTSSAMQARTFRGGRVHVRTRRFYLLGEIGDAKVW